MRLVVAVILCLQTPFAGAQLYRWTDASGRVHYTDTPPPGSAKQVERKSVNISTSTPVEPYALQQARKNAPVKLYSAPGCEPCDAARTLLNSRGVPFSEVSITGEPDQLEELKKAIGTTAVPALLVGSTAQAGFEEAIYHRLLDNAGYPKPGVLPARHQSAPAPNPVKAPDEGGSEGESAEPAPPAGPYAPRFR